MPNVDGGHYFLTVLVPLRIDPVEGDPARSRTDALLEVLETIPTAAQTPACEASGMISPFVRNKRTHFTRFAVIDDTMYNGRIGKDPILVAIQSEDPVIPQHQDKLGRPYLIWTVDFDNPTGSEDPSGYLRELWGEMEGLLRAIFSHCYGFSDVKSADDFAAYICKCQIETTMSFNDYWPGRPPLTPLPLWKLLLPAIPTGIFLVVWAVSALLGLSLGPTWLLTVIAVVGVVLSVWWAYDIVVRTGSKPFPPAPDSDLKSVLKALYLQREFTRFVVENQGADPVALKAAFGKFLEEHRPTDIDGPTQAPGIVPPPLNLSAR